MNASHNCNTHCTFYCHLFVITNAGQYTQHTQVEIDHFEKETLADHLQPPLSIPRHFCVV